MNTLSAVTDPIAVPRPQLVARYAITGARVALGLLFTVCGLNGFLNFIPPPAEPMPEAAVAFGTALAQAGYMFPLIKGTELVAGALLVANRFVPLALVLLAPIVVNIVAFHAFLAPGGEAVVLFVLIAGLLLAFAHRQSYRALFVARSVPRLSRQ